MNLNRRHALGVLAATSSFAIAQPFSLATAATTAISEQEFLRLQKVLQGDATESWRTIPWKIGLLDAQRTSAQQHKPIFIWAMDGHPLGCT